jgi:lipopolysaccharide transport system permease protein
LEAVGTAPGASRALLPGGASTYAAVLRSWIKRQLVKQYRQSALRTWWVVLQPVLIIGLYTIVFTKILDVGGGDLPYLSALIAGVILYRLLAMGIGQATALVENAQIMEKLSFPAEMPALANTLAATVDVAVGVVGLVVVGWFQGYPPTAWVVLAPLPVLVILLYAAGLSVFLCTTTVLVRDVSFIIPWVLQGVFFMSAITYSADLLPRWAQLINPITVCAEALRDVALRGQAPDMGALATHLVIGLVVLVGAVAHVRAVQHRLVDVI